MYAVSEWLGLLDYSQGLAAQLKASDYVTQSNESRILGLEHLSVITLGKRGRPEEDLLYPQEALKSDVFDLHFTDRGGHATLHSPGQLVIYPIVPLRAWNMGVREYVERLEETTINFLGSHGIPAIRKSAEPGLYTSRGKIAFFGIRVSKGIASHGISINIANDLGLFSHIRSCGVSGESFDRMHDHGIDAPLNSLFQDWFQQFLRTFDLTERPSGD